jgi:uncharacterized membrane protein
MCPIDHDILRFIRNKGLPSDDTNTQIESSKDQKRRSRLVNGYVKVLGDQQLVTGFAILIAGLVNRCQISFYEFNVVTSIAYFAAFSHLLSLHILQEYLYLHKTTRTWHVLFIIVFVCIFSFAYVINSVSNYLDTYVTSNSLNPWHALQCVFEASKIGKAVQFDYLDSISVVGVILFNYVFAIGELYFPPGMGFATVIACKGLAVTFRNTQLTREELEDIAYNSDAKYSAWLRPSREGGPQQRISVWYFIESYHRTELSHLPFIVGGLSYGTTRVAIAVWYSSLTPTAGLLTFGFGQVVALGLLALTFLSAIEIANGMLRPKAVHISKARVLTPCN